MFDFMMDDFGQQSTSLPTGPNVPDKMDCMRCGICLSQCPTYVLTQDEQEGPRQRIRTLSDLVLEDKTVDDETIEHLNNCLQCRACEAICPSKMAYSELFDKAQQKLSIELDQNSLAALAFHLISEKKQLQRVLPLVKLYHLSGLRWLAQNTGLLKMMGLEAADRMSRAPVVKGLATDFPTHKALKGHVALFTGCISEHFDRATLDSAIKVLNVMGYGVSVPESQQCCGAIHYHNGEAETAKKLMQDNRVCFNELKVDAIIYCATGCGSQLQEYEKALDLTDEKAFTPPLFEVMDFINQHWDESLKAKPSFRDVAVHEPCSQRNVLKTQQAVYDVLKKVPGLRLQELAENNLCCGAGGSYMLTHPDTANTLCDNKWKHIKQSEVNCVVTSNIGCALHLENGDSALKTIEIIHPVTLLASQLEDVN